VLEGRGIPLLEQLELGLARSVVANTNAVSSLRGGMGYSFSKIFAKQKYEVARLRRVTPIITLATSLQCYEVTLKKILLVLGGSEDWFGMAFPPSLRGTAMDAASRSARSILYV